MYAAIELSEVKDLTLEFLSSIKQMKAIILLKAPKVDSKAKHTKENNNNWKTNSNNYNKGASMMNLYDPKVILNVSVEWSWMGAVYP